MGKSTQFLSIQHFSHPHPLELTTFPQSSPPPLCAACTARISAADAAYSCKLCRFVLHADCSKLPQLIGHPAHEAHSLSLLAVPAYPGGLFNCDACGGDGTGFSYHCRTCSVDVHPSCAGKPLVVSHRAHAHPLFLAFSPPYVGKSFSCDICRATAGSNLSSKHWLYRCAACEFDAHLSCATAVMEAAPPPPQPHAMGPHPTGIGHSRSWHGYGGGFGAPVPEIHRAASLGNSHLFGGGPAMGMPGYHQQLPYAGGGGARYEGNAAVNDFISGMVQQSGQDLVNSIIGGGGSGSGSGDGDGDGDGDGGGSILGAIVSNAVGGFLSGGN